MHSRSASVTSEVCSYLYSCSDFSSCDSDASSKSKKHNITEIQEKQRGRCSNLRRRRYSTESINNRNRECARKRRFPSQSGSIEERRSSRGSCCSYAYSTCSSEEEADFNEKETKRRIQYAYSTVQENENDEYRRNTRSTEAERREFSDDFVYNDGNLVRRHNFDSSGCVEEIDNCSVEGTENCVQKNSVSDVISHIVYNRKSPSQEDRLWQLYDQGFRRMPPRNRIIHDIYEALDQSRGLRLDSELINRQFTGAILLIFEHADHIHIIHDCAYSNNSCRCKFTKYFENYSKGFGRRYNRRVIPSIEYTLQHWVNTTKYSQKGQRRCCHLEVAGRIWIQSDQTGCIRFLESAAYIEESMVAERNLQEHLLDFIDCGPQGSINKETSEFSCTGYQENTESRTRGKGNEIVLFLQKRPTSPLAQIFSSSAWLKSKYKFFDINSTMIKNCRVSGGEMGQEETWATRYY